MEYFGNKLIFPGDYFPQAFQPRSLLQLAPVKIKQSLFAMLSCLTLYGAV
jgi:hypothetical protein